jgi:hypothetical protein
MTLSPRRCTPTAPHVARSQDRLHAFVTARVAACSAAFVACIASAAFAQVVNPADAQKPPDKKATPPLDQALQPDQVPSTTVTAKRVSELREEDLVGPYNQPEWTTARRFPSTRVYVRPPETVAFEYWLRPTIPRHGATQTKTQYEVEIGLPEHFQLDVYMTSNSDGQKGDFGFNEQSVELRWAFADWNAIPMNPTLYLEYTFGDKDPDAIEGKLLLGDEISTGWHWGLNLVYERQISGELQNTYELTGGISRTLSDERFSLGAELKTSLNDVHGSRGDFSKELLIGPSAQYRAGTHVHVDLAPLVGIGGESPAAQIFLVAGYEF